MTSPAPSARDLAQALSARGVHTLLAQFTDVHGTAKGKLLPLAQLGQVLGDGAGFAGPSIWGTDLPRHGPRSEYMGRGDPGTLTVLPWMPGCARIVCDGFVGGQPFDACPRQVLRRQVARLAERGWQLQLGIEPEFFLLRRTEHGIAPADDDDRLDKPSYDLKALGRQQGFLQGLAQALADAGLQVLQIDHEDAWGQYELNLAHAPALASADALMLFKLAAHALARERGLQFSMMPKPWADQPGSGMHFHVSLWTDAEPAHSLFAAGAAQGADAGAGGGASGVPAVSAAASTATTAGSALMAAFVAGVLHHAPALTALACPTVNSYKRLWARDALSGTTWAPATVSHGPNNRTAQIRTLTDRFEWRLPDASANPYLAAAGLIAAGLDGIDRGLPLPPACQDDLYVLTRDERLGRGVHDLPRDLDAACEALSADAVVLDALGPTLARTFPQLKRAEHAQWAAQVTPWELARYLDAF